MPAQITVFKGQVKALAGLDTDVILLEQHPDTQTIVVWVMDDENPMQETHHRDIILDHDGNTLTDSFRGDLEA